MNETKYTQEIIRELVRLANRVATRQLAECSHCKGTGKWHGDGCLICGGVGDVVADEITVQDVLDAKAIITKVTIPAPAISENLNQAL